MRLNLPIRKEKCFFEAESNAHSHLVAVKTRNEVEWVVYQVRILTFSIGREGGVMMVKDVIFCIVLLRLRVEKCFLHYVIFSLQI